MKWLWYILAGVIGFITCLIVLAVIAKRQMSQFETWCRENLKSKLDDEPEDTQPVTFVTEPPPSTQHVKLEPAK